MSFSTTPGTRGARVPGGSGPVARWIQQKMSNQHRRKGGKFMGMDVLFLTTVGRKTGERRQTPVSWFADGEDSWIIVASSGGTAGNPAWYLNLAANPGQVWIELPQQQRTVKVSPEQLDGEQRERAWSRITAAQPRYAKYQQKTDRAIPVIRLTAAADQS